LSRTRTARTQVRTLKSEVGAAETSLIRGVHNNAEISNESRRVLLGGQEQVDVAVEYGSSVFIIFYDVKSGDSLRREAGSSHVSMLAREVSNFALIRLGGIAFGHLSGAVRVQVRASRGAVQAGDGEFMDVIHCGSMISSRSDIQTRTRKHSLKGPPVAGSPEIETCTLAPVPFEFVFTATAPRTGMSVLLGSMAMYCVPIGLLSTTGASPGCSSVEGTSLGASLLGAVGALGTSLLGAFTCDGSVLVVSTNGASLAGVSGAVGASGLSAAGASGAAGGSSAGGASGVAGGSSAGGGSAASGAAGALSAGASSCANAISAKSARNKIKKRMIGRRRRQASRSSMSRFAQVSLSQKVSSLGAGTRDAGGVRLECESGRSEVNKGLARSARRFPLLLQFRRSEVH
jgi:hypothetical protein